MTRILKFIFGWTLPFLYWLAPSLTEQNGKTSGRKLSACITMFLIISTTSKILMKENPTMIHVYLLCVLGLIFLLLQGIITFQNVIDLWKNGRLPDSIPNTNDQTNQEKK